MIILSIDWTLLQDRTIWLTIGCVIGLPLGYGVKSAKDAYKVAKEAHEEAHDAHLRVVKLERELHPTREQAHG